MKLDLIEINRLSPPGLWDLGVLVAAISMLRRVLANSVISAETNFGSALIYGRMVVRYSESLREKTRDNLNMRIKFWVLQCPSRIAFVRCIIGASAIRYWRTNRLLDYALTQYFGDWKCKFPDGFTNSDTKSKRQGAPKFRQQTRTYKWKLFALVKTVNVQAFLYRKRTPSAAENAEEQKMRDAYYKLWGVAPGDDKILRKWTQPHGARILKPIRFMSYELKLEPEEAAETLPSIVIPQDVPKRIEGDVEPKLKLGEPLPEKPP